MNDEDLSVRLDWPERTNEPFRPVVDHPDGSATAAIVSDDEAMAWLDQTVAALRAEVAELRSELSRLRLEVESVRGAERMPAGTAQRAADASSRSIRLRTRRSS